MAHIVLATRGPKMWVDNMIAQLQGQWLPWEVKKKGKFGAPKAGMYTLQTRVCPVQFWDVSFPKPFTDVMINTLFTNEGQTQNPKHQKYFAALRLALGLKKIPKADPKAKHLAMKSAVKHTEMIGIGYKEDRFEDGTEMI